MFSRFQIAVDDALLMGRGKALGDVPRVRNRGVDGQGAAIEDRAQRLTVDRLGDNIGRLLVGADVMDGQYVRMRELGCRARLLHEALQAIRIGYEIGPQHPEGDSPLQVVVTRVRHLAEPRHLAGRTDLVGTEARSGCHRHCARILPSTGHLGRA